MTHRASSRAVTAPILWTLGGFAFLASGFLMNPPRPLTFVAGILFFVVAGVTYYRAGKGTD